MSSRALAAVLCATAFGVLAPVATFATGFTDLGTELTRQDKAAVELDGYFRLRGELLGNLDLDRGLTPSGDSLFPVPVASPERQVLTHHDMRLRTDLALRPPHLAMAVRTRIDVVDNLTLGSSPEGPAAVTQTQEPIESAFRIKRLYGEVLTPIGLVSAGRMGSHWGLGMLTNGGDCADCDSGDAGDRVSLVTPIGGLVWAVAYELSSTGPGVERSRDALPVDVEATDAVRTFAFAVMRWRTDMDRERRLRAGRNTFNWGAYLSHRRQANDVPATWYPGFDADTIGPEDFVSRGFRATIVDGWLRFDHPSLRVELEAAWATARVDQPSVVPGVLLAEGVTSHQWGAALESEGRLADGRVLLGVDAGAASGDDAPGWGVRARPGDAVPVDGDASGPQGNPPSDRTADEFRFHPDYRVDRILFRELVGAVADATYVRPHVTARLASSGPNSLSAGVAGVASWAMRPSTTPSGERPLGFEVDTTLLYASEHGIGIALEHAVFLPGAAFDNPSAGLAARTAWSLRARTTLAF